MCIQPIDPKPDRVSEQIKRGISEQSRDSVLEIQRQWIRLTELRYTKPQVDSDVFTSFLRLYGRN